MKRKIYREVIVSECCTLPYLSDKFDSVGGTCGMHARVACAGVWRKTLKDRDHVEDLGLDGARILKRSRNFMSGCGLGLLE